MQLHNLFPFPEERKTRRRVGRGSGSGLGCTAGKGNKGQNARAGGGVRPGFEGGQMPLYRRLPKRGFNNYNFATRYAIVNLTDLCGKFEDGAVVDTEAMVNVGLVNNVLDGVKVLGDGEMTKNLTVKAAAFSKSAIAKIEAAGGKAEVM